MTFLAEQGDFILCVQGFALIFLALACGLWGRTAQIRMYWSWLGAFAFIAGLSRWLELLTPLLQNQIVFHGGIWALRGMALIALLEFGRRSWPLVGSRWVPGLYGVLGVTAAALMAWGGWRALEMGSLWILGLLGGGLAAVALRRNAAPEGLIGGPVWMTLTGGLLGLFLLTALVLMPPAQPWILTGAGKSSSVLWLISQGAALIFGVATVLLLLLLLQSLRPRKTAPYLLWSLPALTVALMGGWVFTDFASSVEETERRDHLLQRVQTAAAALDQQMMVRLTGTTMDNTQSAWLRLRELLRRVKQANVDVRFAYLLVWRQGQVVILADSEPATSRDYSPPGQVYDEASAEVRHALISGVSFLEGPLTDRWGTWISGFAPVRGMQNRLPAALFGMDVAVTTWQVAKFYQRLAAIGLTLLVSLLLLALYAGLQIVKDSAQEIAASENRFRALFENAPEAMIVFAADTGRILAANPFVTRWLGYPVEELYGQTLFDLTPAKERPSLEAALRAPDTKAREGVFRKKDGGSARVEITQTTLRFYGRPAVLAFVRDVTDRKQDEDKLRKTMSELERFNRVMVGREMRVLELKKEVNALLHRQGLPLAYPVAEKGSAAVGTEGGVAAPPGAILNGDQKA